VFVTTWPEDLFGIFSAKLLEEHVEVDLFGIFSAKLLDGVVDVEAELEILVIFPLLFLLGRDRRGEALE
jgi:hypothetical protein